MRGWIDTEGIGAAAPGSAAQAYDDLAPAYDDLTADYQHDRWVAALVDLAREHGLSGRRALDVACGTGKSFIPLLDLGFEVSACDASTGMLTVAALKATAATLYHADMRALPAIGEFDLITCLDDSLNHLLDEREVVAALKGMFRNLTPGGLVVFDVNTLRGFRSSWTSDEVLEMDSRVMLWRGQGHADMRPGGESAVQIDVFTKTQHGLGGWARETTRHRERHYPVGDVRDMAIEAGFEVVATRGQSTGIRFAPRIDEGLHTKGLFLLRRDDAPGR